MSVMDDYHPGISLGKIIDDKASDIAIATQDLADATRSLIAHSSRQKLEEDILALTATQQVQNALKDWADEMVRTSESVSASSTIQESAGKPVLLKREFDRGVRAILNASSDKRLETSHWMLSKIQKTEEWDEVVEWFFEEAGHQSSEADVADAKVIASIFGVSEKDRD